ncbi:hypothetical protein AQUCO_05800203v1 [Aquilegia coerulea]|uniref:DUF7903 domain-containing protein n=1 Tax=Aquilegia coerulea TaxID=218851 RepID=A0A2G5CF87_AQUCA|nr:hypothetical protein AQUCO_05800203v1 [Aquilegia coerulea]
MQCRLMMFCQEDDERHSLRKLIKTGVVDSEEKCGLRWPLGRESSGGRYCVAEVWRTKVQTFKNSFVKLKVRNVHRFNLGTSTVEVMHEASLRISELTKQLRDKTKPIPSADMLHDTLKLVWDHFLCWEGSFA